MDSKRKSKRKKEKKKGRGERKEQGTFAVFLFCSTSCKGGEEQEWEGGVLWWRQKVLWQPEHSKGRKSSCRHSFTSHCFPRLTNSISFLLFWSSLSFVLFRLCLGLSLFLFASLCFFSLLLFASLSTLLASVCSCGEGIYRFRSEWRHLFRIQKRDRWLVSRHS